MFSGNAFNRIQAGGHVEERGKVISTLVPLVTRNFDMSYAAPM